MAKKPTTLQKAIREQIAERARLEAIGVVGLKRMQPKLNPGSLPMPTATPRDDHDGIDAELLEVIRNARPPWHGESPKESVPLVDEWALPAAQPSPSEVAAALKKYRAAKGRMGAARRDMDALKPAVRDEAFEYWIRRYVVSADSRNEWTMSNTLYENYISHGGEHGSNRGDKVVSKAEQISLTRFGILMRDAGFAKERRRAGQYYPLRLKQGA